LIFLFINQHDEMQAMGEEVAWIVYFSPAVAESHRTHLLSHVGSVFKLGDEWGGAVSVCELPVSGHNYSIFVMFLVV
jgi:hypothetical protein